MPEGLSPAEVSKEIAEHRERSAHEPEAEHEPPSRRALTAWLATDPAHNPNSPPGPSYMRNYVITQAAAARAADAAADEAFARAPTPAKLPTSTSATRCSWPPLAGSQLGITPFGR
jgi:hypothetical protein